MRLPTSLMTGVLFLCAVGARAQTMKGGKIDPAWLRADAASKTADFKLVAGLTRAHCGGKFNGLGPGGLRPAAALAWDSPFPFHHEGPDLPPPPAIIPGKA